MLAALNNWAGKIEINGVLYDSVKAANSALKSITTETHIILHPISQKQDLTRNKVEFNEDTTEATIYKIQVRKYMTRKASPEFDFMAKWNNDNPMPYRIMIGTKEKETRGMVYMKLHADITEEKTFTCMCCGRPLTNPVSQFFGIGPECGGHNYTHPFDTDEELKAEVAKYREQLRNVTWEGWIIKSAIEEEEVI